MKRLARPVVVMGALLGMLGVLSCKSLDGGATEHFGVAYSCPENRVATRERKDIPAEYALDPRWKEPAASPSPDIASDPERLEKWRSDRSEILATHTLAYAAYEIYEVTGCGKTELLACRHPTGRRGGVVISSVACEPVTWPRDAGPSPPSPPPPAPEPAPPPPAPL